MSQTVLRESDDGETVRVSSGDHIVVDLPENPTTGFRWEIDTSVAPLTNSDTSYAAPDGIGIGGGGRRRFTFVASDTGEATIRATLRRPWEPTSKAAAHYALKIQIE